MATIKTKTRVATINLQIPNVSKSVKDKVEAFAGAEGFSSVQEFLRVFMTRIANGKVHPDQIFGNVVEEYITPEEEDRMIAEIEETYQEYKEGKGKSIFSGKDLTDLLNKD
jgi:hypothetical protein